MKTAPPIPSAGGPAAGAALALFIGAAAALALGALDGTVQLLAGQKVPSAARTLSVVAVASIAILACWSAAFAAAWPWHRFRRDRALPLAAALAVLAAALLLPVWATCHGGGWPSLAGIARGFPPALLLGTGTLLLARRLARLLGFDAALSAIALAAALVALELLAATWLANGPAALWKPGSALAPAGLLLVAAATAGLAWGLRARSPARGLLGGAGAVLLALALIALAAGAGGSGGGESPPASSRHRLRHVILVVVDTLRADRLSCASDRAPRTPHLDALAGEGVLFEEARASSSFTLPSVSTILTGVPPAVHRVDERGSALPRSLPTLAERMRGAGYRTAAFVRNAFLTPGGGLDRGFDEYHCLRPPSPPGSLGEVLRRALWPDPDVGLWRGELQTRLALRWIERHRDEDFFLWLHYLDPHVPYDPPSDLAPPGGPPPGMGTRFQNGERIRGGRFVPDLEERRWIEGLYDGEVRSFDECFGELAAGLKRLGIYDQALIVLTSDHGEEFWEHGGYEHGHSMYDEVLRVPLVVRLPGAALSERVGEPVSHESLAPAILSLCGVGYDPADFPLPPLVEDLERPRVRSGGEPLVSSGMLYFEKRTAVVFEGWKYVRFELTGREELYDLERDPGEARERSGLEPERLREGRALLEEHLARASEMRLRLGLRDERAELDADTERALRELGYAE